jgi:hypothetical protein
MVSEVEDQLKALSHKKGSSKDTQKMWMQVGGVFFINTTRREELHNSGYENQPDAHQWLCTYNLNI